MKKYLLRFFIFLIVLYYLIKIVRAFALKYYNIHGEDAITIMLAISLIILYSSPLILIGWFLYKKYRNKIGNSFKSKTTYSEYGLNLKTTKGDLLVQNPFRGIFVIGAAGSGKSESLAVPLLQNFIEKGFTGIVYDFKFPALALEVNTFLKSSSSKAKGYYVSFNNPLTSNKLNPLKPEYLLTTSHAREYAQSIVSNLMKESINKPDFWSRSAVDLLTAIIWFLKEEYPKFCDLPHAFAMVTSNDEKVLKILQKNPVSSQMTMSIYNAMERKAGNQVAGVIGSLQSIISQINTPELMYIFSGDEVPLDVNNPEHPSILTIGNSPTLSTTFAPLCSLIITVCTKLMNRPGQEPSFIMLDEAPTVFIPNLETIPNTGRSNKMSTVLICQDIAQLTDGYGKQKSDILFAACNNHFYGRVSSSLTSELLSKQFGKKDVTYTSKGKSKQDGFLGASSSSKNESVQERDIIKPAEFLNLSVGEFTGILVESNVSTFRSKFIPTQRNVQALDTHTLTYPNAISEYYRKVREEITLLLDGNYNNSLENNNKEIDIINNDLFKL